MKVSLRERNLLIVVMFLFMLVFITGCAGEESQPKESEQLDGSKQEGPNIGGIQLGDSKEKVVQVLGEDYEEISHKEPAYYGEPHTEMQYEGIDIIIGDAALEVFDIHTESPEFEAGLGAKVGDNAQEVLEIYRSRYGEFENRHSGTINEGWFVVDEGILMIFDVNRDDYTCINPEIDSNSEIEAIKLAYIRHFD